MIVKTKINTRDEQYLHGYFDVLRLFSRNNFRSVRAGKIRRSENPYC